MNYLYIIPIEKQSIFKIGITTNLHTRLNQHQSNWRESLGDIDMTKVKYLKSKSGGKISLIEQHLKYLFEENLANVNLSGHTEIYNISCFGSVMDELSSISSLYALGKICDYSPANVVPKKVRYKKEKDTLNELESENRMRIMSFTEHFRKEIGRMTISQNSNYSIWFKLNLADAKNNYLDYVSPFRLTFDSPNGNEGANCFLGARGGSDYLEFGLIKSSLTLIKKTYPDLWREFPAELKFNVACLDS